MEEQTQPLLFPSHSPDESNIGKDADEAFALIARRLSLVEQGKALLADDQRYQYLVRKIDWTIAPLLAAVCLFQFLDKITLGYAAVMGLREDARLTGEEYAYLASLFYIGMIVAELPTQYLAQRFSRPAFYLGINVLLWGMLLGLHAACSSFATLAICRILLGMVESCATPIMVLIITMWYKKEEQAWRMSWWYSSTSIGQILGGAVAFGISSSDGRSSSWRLFYLTIGALTLIPGVLVILKLPDSPTRAHTFTDIEKAAAILRTQHDGTGIHNAHVKRAQVVETLLDRRLWLVWLAAVLVSVPNGGLTNFTSTLLTTFGFTPRQALLLNMPTGAISLVFVLLSGYLSDRWRNRSLVMLVCAVPTIISAAMMISLDPHGRTSNKTALMAASFLSGTFGPAYLVLLAWNASNIAGHTKKVTTNSLTAMAQALGNIVGNLTFRAAEDPGYVTGKASIVISLLCLCVVVGWLRILNERLNRHNESLIARMSEREKKALKKRLAFGDYTDRENVFFRYTS